MVKSLFKHSKVCKLHAEVYKQHGTSPHSAP